MRRNFFLVIPLQAVQTSLRQDWASYEEALPVGREQLQIWNRRLVEFNKEGMRSMTFPSSRGGQFLFIGEGKDWILGGGVVT